MTRTLRARRAKPRVFTYVMMVVLTIITIYPVVWMLGGSIKPADEIFSNPSPFTASPTLQNYVDGWAGAGVPFSVFLINSGIVAGLAVVGNVIACTLTAYGFARFDFRGKNVLFALVLLTVMLPKHVRLISEYIGFANIGLIDTFVPLILPHFLAIDGFFIFLLVQFIRGLPPELEEAARVDGCTEFGVFWRVVVPLLTPALVTTAILTFVQVYQDFFSQLIYLNSPENYTVPLGLRQFIDSTSSSAWGPVLAMSSVALVPVVVLFLIFQRRIIDGIATTGLKG
ncbi:carbohydrate ABC transporter permease [Salinibacterium sp. PAMC 21357]|uniref:carbohydrate ABC transporter permease n=1 Tax=Salinibacterium sp. PAMC 21357 TaxID=1112215 RepID=UPI00028925A9|nr:carbohydrate ABC transporter permease [Salinibacterium sp. PAMC 21357]